MSKLLGTKIKHRFRKWDVIQVNRVNVVDSDYSGDIPIRYETRLLLSRNGKLKTIKMNGKWD